MGASFAFVADVTSYTHCQPLRPPDLIPMKTLHSLATTYSAADACTERRTNVIKSRTFVLSRGHDALNKPHFKPLSPARPRSWPPFVLKRKPPVSSFELNWGENKNVNQQRQRHCDPRPLCSQNTFTHIPLFSLTRKVHTEVPPGPLCAFFCR